MPHENNQQLQGDIRRAYDIHSRDVERICIILQTRPPLTAKGGNFTGLQCLTAVLRRIHSHAMLGPEGLAKADHFKQAETENPIIGFSWLMFGKDESLAEMRHGDWMQTKEQLQAHGHRAYDTFEELCTSRTMNHTYWSQNEMRLLEPKMCLETWQVINESTEEIASSGLVTLDKSQSPDMTLEQAVESSFGIARREGKPTLHRPREPLIIRVLYDPGSGSRLSFQDLRGFNLPVWRETQDRERRFDTSGRAQYVLLAVVRMRCHPKRKDLVRLYATTGAEIIPEYRVDCMKNDWSVEDDSRYRYMLFYSPPGHYVNPKEAASYPEVARPLIEDDKEIRDFHTLTRSVMNPFIEKEIDRAATAGDPAEPGEVREDSPRQSPQRSDDLSQQRAGRDRPTGEGGNWNRRQRHSSHGQGSGRPAKKPRLDSDVNSIPLGTSRMLARDRDNAENRD